MSEDDPARPDLFATDVLAADVTAEGPRLVDTPLGKLAFVRDREAVLAIDAWCPHLDGPLWEGSAAGGEIACPWHRWRFSLRTGRCTWAPAGDAEEAAETEIRIFRTQTTEGGRLSIVFRNE